MPRRSLSRDTLHEIGARRRKDRDVTALLWEIKRLRDLLATIAGQLVELRHDEPVHREYFQTHLEDLLEVERVRFGPGTVKPTRLYGGEPERGPVTGHAERRAQRVTEENERGAKQQERTEREGTQDERAAKRAAARKRG